jgi:hypothetical protein
VKSEKEKDYLNRDSPDYRITVMRSRTEPLIRIIIMIRDDKVFIQSWKSYHPMNQDSNFFFFHFFLKSPFASLRVLREIIFFRAYTHLHRFSSRRTNMYKNGFLAVLFLFSFSAVQAAEYYVSPAGSAAWNQSTNIKTPCSLETANANARAGDTVYLRGGVYTAWIAPAKSGNSDTERITYAGYKDERVEISGARYAILLEGKSYITVRGIEFRTCHQFLIISGGHHNDIGHCVFDKNMLETTWMGSWVHESSTFNRIHDCTFSRYGWVSKGDDKGAILDIGYDVSTTDASNYNVIENNTFFYGGHHILQICGKNNIVRGNYFHNEAWMPGPREGGCGNRNAMTMGPMASRNLFENNRFAFAGIPPDDNGADGIAVRCPRNILRRNMFYASGAAGIALASMKESQPTGNCIYSNTIYHNGYNSMVDHFWTGGISFGNWGNGPLPGNIIVNNLLHDNIQKKSLTGYGEAGPQIVLKNWMDEGDPGFVNGTIPTDTADSSLPDFRLKPGSPCIDRGVSLTKITGPSGKGATFAVENAGFFFDGWGIPGERGDLIQLEDSKETARIVRIDYEKNSITVDKPLSWKQGQGVSLAYEGKAPDLGAWEFGGR